MIRLNFSSNFGYRWYLKEDSNSKLFIKGYLFDKDGIFYKDNSMLDYFVDCKDEKEFVEKVTSANGSFCICSLDSGRDQLIAAVDRVRSIPLFYAYENEDLIISDNAYWIQAQLGDLEIDPVSVKEFLLTGYVVGENTLIKSIKQLQAGECLIFNPRNEVSTKLYYTHFHKDYVIKSQEEYFDDLDKIYDKVFQRLIRSVENRTIVIPLSGGYDSRSIATMLRKLDYDKVICFTYGNQNSFEVNIAKKVVDCLGLQWHYIEYTPKKWSMYYNTSRDYVRYSSNFASLPHVQEFIAIKELKERELIPADSIIVPGFCGDLLGGSYVPLEVEEKRIRELINEGIVNYIYRRHFNLDNKIKPEYESKIKKHIADIIYTLTGLSDDSYYNLDIEDFVSINECFFTMHKVAKFVLNALRVYEFFGYEWRIPLWDNELVEYWYHIPVDKRIGNNKIYEIYLFERLFKEYKVDITKKNAIENKLSKNLKKIVQGRTLRLLRRIYDDLRHLNKDKVDINYFSHLYSLCKEDLKGKAKIFPKSDNINSIYSLWFVEIFLSQEIDKFSRNLQL